MFVIWMPLSMNAALQTYHLELVMFYVQTSTYLPTHYSQNPSLWHWQRHLIFLEKPITEKPVRLLKLLMILGAGYWPSPSDPVMTSRSEEEEEDYYVCINTVLNSCMMCIWWDVNSAYNTWAELTSLPPVQRTFKNLTFTNAKVQTLSWRYDWTVQDN